jgi:hypothetical protein
MPLPPPPPALTQKRPAPLTLPPPEELGVTLVRKKAAPDWNAIHRRLGQAGASDFRLDKLPQGGYRATLFLPTGQKNCKHHIEAPGTTEAEAVCLALDRAEKWAGRSSSGGSE